MSVVPDWDASCVRVWVLSCLVSFVLLCSGVCVCRLEGPFRVLSFGAWVGVSEHVCSVVLLVLLVRRWMCLCLSSLPPFFSVIPLVCYGSYVACLVCGGRTPFPLLVSGGRCVWCATWPRGTGKGPGYPSRLVSRFRCVFRCTGVFRVSRRVSRDLS